VALARLDVQGYDIMEEMYNTKTAAMNFIHELCSKRPKGNLDQTMGLIIGVMNSFAVWPQFRHASSSRCLGCLGCWVCWVVVAPRDPHRTREAAIGPSWFQDAMMLFLLFKLQGGA
jgi:hypothetical protein